MYSKFKMLSPGGKQVRFNNVSYKIPCEIIVNTETESLSLENYFKACGYKFEVQKTIKTINKKSDMAKADNAKPAPSKVEPAKKVEPVEPVKEEPVVVDTPSEPVVETESVPVDNEEKEDHKTDKRKKYQKSESETEN